MINENRVERIIQFIECLIVPSGKGSGNPFKVRGWQRDFINDVYGPCNEDRTRIVRRAILSIARKNGKTALIAALVLVHLIGPESIQNGEIYSAANEREQAAIIYKMCSQIIRADPELESMLTLVDSTKTIVNYGNGSFYKSLSSEASSKHGYNPSFVIYDELAQAKKRDLYDALDTSMGAREEPLFATISTQSNDPNHILSLLIDDGITKQDPSTVVHLYAVEENVEDIFDESKWYAANPALGDFRSLEDMRVMAARAKRMPSFEATFRNLYLNQRINAESPLVPRAEWVGCQDNSTTLEDGEDVYLALDLSATTDLTAAVAVSATDGDRIKSWFWKPQDTLKEHEDRDRVPYTLWEKQGIINAVPGRSVHYGFIAQELAEMCSKYHVLGVAYDRWRINDLLREIGNIGIETWVDGRDTEIPGALKLVPWGQGFKDMAPAIDALEISILERRLKHDGNPCLTWNMSNALVLKDPSGNRKLDKSKARFRIDGAVAAAMVIGLKGRDVPVEDPEFQIIIV
jgi:phage terminase large subunit-like protein